MWRHHLVCHTPPTQPDAAAMLVSEMITSRRDDRDKRPGAEEDFSNSTESRLTVNSFTFFIAAATAGSTMIKGLILWTELFIIRVECNCHCLVISATTTHSPSAKSTHVIVAEQHVVFVNGFGKRLMTTEDGKKASYFLQNHDLTAVAAAAAPDVSVSGERANFFFVADVYKFFFSFPHVHCPRRAADVM